MKVSQTQMDRARERVEQLEERYLLGRGWEYTSKTPTRRWFWKKTTEHGTLLVSRADALEIESMT